MPRMGGGELAQRLRAERPGLKVLFASGHIGDEVLADLDDDGESPLIQKPYQLDQLERRIRETLDE